MINLHRFIQINIIIKNSSLDTEFFFLIMLHIHNVSENMYITKIITIKIK